MPQAPALAWAAFHTLWVTLLVWAIAAAAGACLRSTRARVRYAVAWIGLLSAVAVAAATLLVVTARPLGDLGQPGVLPSGQTDLLRIPSLTLARSFRPLGALLPYALIAWTVCGIGRIGWLVLARWSATRTADRSRGVDAATLPDWPALRATLAPGADVSVVESAAVDSPATFGWRRPVILLPAGFTQASRPDDLRAVLAHELAHVGRRDYLANLAQVVIESVFFFNVGVLLLSRAVRHRRESCCDELALAALGVDYTVYVAAIFRLAKAANAGAAVPATGGSLLDRFRYLRRHPHYLARPTWLFTTAGCVLIMMILIGAAGVTAVREVATAQQIESLQQADFTASVYALLGQKEADNPRFLVDVQAGVDEWTASRVLARETALRLADDAAAGVRHDALLNASLSSFTAASPRPLSTRGWTGGGKRDWQKVACELQRLATEEPDRATRGKLSRAALVLAAQDDLTPGSGKFRTLASDPTCLEQAGVSEAQGRALWTVTSVAASDCQNAMLMESEWEAGQPTGLTPRLIEAARSRPFLQWVICNTVDRVRSTDPARYRALCDSIRSANLSVARELLP